MRSVLARALLVFSAASSIAAQVTPPSPPPVAAPKVPAPAGDAAPIPGLTLEGASFEQIWSQVVPGAADLEWQRIPWRGVLADAVHEARAADKPILLWAMNGHPLGCT